MWGIIVAAVIYAVAIGFNIAKEGMRQNRTQTDWSMEEIEKIKGSAVMGWKLLIIMLMVVGVALFAYDYFVETDPGYSYLWIQVGCAMFTAAVISIGVLLYARKNPSVYKIICIMKPEKEIRPTIAQRVEKEVKGIMDENFSGKKPDMTDLTNAYYEAKQTSDTPGAQDLMREFERSKKEDSFEREKKAVQFQSSEVKRAVEKEHVSEDNYYEKYVELLEKYVDLLEKYNELKQDD